jgi:GDPmannose 4,6-dehydratase
MSKIALITGISGQDGSYLSEHLLEEGFEVHGIIRRHSVAETQNDRITQDLLEHCHFHYGDMLDEMSLLRTLKKVQPTHIYNLAAMSHVRISWDMPAFTIKTNAEAVLNLLECYRLEAPEAKFYQASSSEMFGNSVDEDGYQRLSTPMTPTSPYGCAKVMAFNLVNHYRNAYGLHACNGVLFNHESPRRGSNFVTNKVCKGVAQIKKGRINKLELGNMDSFRDWGHSYDYVRAMKLIIEHEVAENWVVATGETRSIRDMCDFVFSYLDMDYRDYVTQNKKYMRPEELKYLRGDSEHTREVLKWDTSYTFESMMAEMVDHWMSIT